MEREITVQGNHAIYHAHRIDPTERKVDFTQHVELLSATVGNLVVTNKPRLIGIVGSTGTGKSGLAKVLKHDGVNVIYIDVYALHEPGSLTADISHLFGDSKATYLIDEFACAEPNCYPVIQEHVEKGGTVVLLVQDKRDISTDLDIDVTWLSMDRKGIQAL